MKSVLSIACAAGLLLLAVWPVQAAPAPTRPDPLTPLRSFIAIAALPASSQPFAGLSDDERGRLDRQSAERPGLPPPGLDALRHAAATPATPGGR